MELDIWFNIDILGNPAASAKNVSEHFQPGHEECKVRVNNGIRYDPTQCW